MPTDAVVALTTLASEDEAVTFVRALLDRRLVACGNILPGARSIYRWEGRVADEREVVVLLKTTTARLAELEAAVGELHPYTVPELLVVNVESGGDAYLRWVTNETAP